MRRRVLGPEHPDTLASANNLAAIFLQEGKHAQAKDLYTEIVDVKRRVLGPEHPYTLLSLINLSLVYESMGEFAKAEALNRGVLDARRRVLGPEAQQTLQSMSELAKNFAQRAEYARAESLYMQTLAISAEHWAYRIPARWPPFQIARPCTRERVSTPLRRLPPRRC